MIARWERLLAAIEAENRYGSSYRIVQVLADVPALTVTLSNGREIPTASMTWSPGPPRRIIVWDAFNAGQALYARLGHNYDGMNDPKYAAQSRVGFKPGHAWSDNPASWEDDGARACYEWLNDVDDTGVSLAELAQIIDQAARKIDPTSVTHEVAADVASVEVET